MMARIKGPGEGYGFNLSKIGEAISRYASTRFFNQKPWGITKTVKAISQYFFGVTKSTLQTIITKGEQAFQAGKKLTSLVREKGVKREEIPIDRTLPKGVAYRAKVLVRVRDGGEGADSFRVVTMDFERNPTATDISSKVGAASQRMLLASPRRDSQGNVITETETTSEFSAVISLVRRT
jgi:hypothetical protein